MDLMMDKILFHGIYVGLNSNDRILYAWLSAMVQEKGNNDNENKRYVACSQHELSLYCCLSERTIRQCFKTLCLYQLIKVKRVGLNRVNNIYVLSPRKDVMT